MQAPQATAERLEHTPRPAYVPSEERHAYQHRFGPKGAISDHPPSLYGRATCSTVDADIEVEVYRDSNRNAAEVRLELIGAFNARALLTPKQLRDLACRLIDAAHDIEAFPAQVAA